MLSATDAVRRHIALDDDNNNNSDNNNNTSQNGRTYIVASQDEKLLDEFRKLGTVPILRVANNNTVLILEHPSSKGVRKEYGKEKDNGEKAAHITNAHG